MQTSRAVLVVVLGFSFSHCSSSSDPDIQSALEEYLAKLPGAYCSWLVSCGELTQDERGACVTEIQTEVSGQASCKALQQFYAGNRAAADACLAGGTGQCGSDDFDAFCPAFSGVDPEKLCASPDGGGSGGDGGTSKLTTAQAVVGAWAGSKTCDATAIEFGYFVCPKGRFHGYEKVGGYDFLDCGTWSVSGDRLTATYQATAVADPTVKENETFHFTYEAASDTLTWVSSCPLVLKRLVGQVEEADCISPSCTAGGTGPITGCNIDCDCGRCWYCESGTCRYGGEGPYGCYRGCGP